MSMHRELNPQLFGTQSSVEKIGQPVDPSRPAQGIMGKGGDPSGPAHGQGGRQGAAYPPIDVKAIEHQLGTLKVALLQMDKRHDSLSSKMEELARTVHGRLERFGGSLARMEELQAQSHQESTGRYAQVVAKVNERRVTDNKIQELIDRHNTIIRNFENRLLSLQRVVTEQEMTLHNAQAALEEARAELSRKR